MADLIYHWYFGFLPDFGSHSGVDAHDYKRHFVVEMAKQKHTTWWLIRLRIRGLYPQLQVH